MSTDLAASAAAAPAVAAVPVGCEVNPDRPERTATLADDDPGQATPTVPSGSQTARGQGLFWGIRRAADRVLDVLLPRRCARCAADIVDHEHGGALLCSACRRLLARPRPPACPRCGGHLAADSPAGCCRRCRSQPPPFASVTFLAGYEYELREAVLAIKTACHEPLAVALAELLWQVRGKELTQLEADVVVPVPMHWARRLERGANAPDVLAERLARRLGLPLCPLLARRRHTVPQASLPGAARLTNLRRAFGLRSSYQCRGARVLLVDDVLTTGTTCGEAAGVLLRQGAASVHVAVLARAG